MKQTSKGDGVKLVPLTTGCRNSDIIRPVVFACDLVYFFLSLSFISTSLCFAFILSDQLSPQIQDRGHMLFIQYSLMNRKRTLFCQFPLLKKVLRKTSNWCGLGHIFTPGKWMRTEGWVVLIVISNMKSKSIAGLCPSRMGRNYWRDRNQCSTTDFW